MSVSLDPTIYKDIRNPLYVFLAYRVWVFVSVSFGTIAGPLRVRAADELRRSGPGDLLDFVITGYC